MSLGLVMPRQGRKLRWSSFEEDMNSMFTAIEAPTPKKAGRFGVSSANEIDPEADRLACRRRLYRLDGCLLRVSWRLGDAQVSDPFRDEA